MKKLTEMNAACKSCLRRGYCKTLIFGSNLILAILEVKANGDKI